jgi:hypothetical protein
MATVFRREELEPTEDDRAAAQTNRMPAAAPSVATVL